jgi:hypothetical protein
VDLPGTFLTLRRSQQDIIINAHMSSSKSLLFLPNDNELQFSQNNQIPKFTQIHPVGADMLQMDGQTR